MSHHYSGPDFAFPQKTRPGPSRICMPSQAQARRTSRFLIMNVHPSAVVNPPGSTTREPFASKALYRSPHDRYERRCRRRHRISGCASRPRGRAANRDRCGASRVRRPPEPGDSGQVMIEAAPVSTGRNARVTEAGRIASRGLAQPIPPSFDTRGALNDLTVHRDDFLIDKGRVQHACWEMPNSPWTQTSRLWGQRTLDGAAGFGLADRARITPRTAVFLVRLGSEIATTRASRANDARFHRPSSRMRGAHRRLCAGGSKAGGGEHWGCPTCCPTDRRVRVFSTNAAASPTMPPDGLLQSSQNKVTGGKRSGPTSICLCQFPLFGTAAHILCTEPCKLRLSATDPAFRKASRSPGSS